MAGRRDARQGPQGTDRGSLVHRIGKDVQAALPQDWLAATIHTLHDEIIERSTIADQTHPEAAGST
ncbi:MAG TPA: hypothetical protein VFF89_07820 [Sphingobium sp.]|nr:hypothetical protein [Sphingobium sp.]